MNEVTGESQWDYPRADDEEETAVDSQEDVTEKPTKPLQKPSGNTDNDGEQIGEDEHKVRHICCHSYEVRRRSLK